MGLFASLLWFTWIDLMRSKIFDLAEEVENVRSPSSTEKDVKPGSNSCKQNESETSTKLSSSLTESLSFKNWCEDQTKLETNVSSKNQHREGVEREEHTGNDADLKLNPENCLLVSLKLIKDLDAAAVKLQKVYKSYRTRRNLADCAVVVEELWWKAFDFASLKHSSISFFGGTKPETAASRWARALTRAAKVGKGLSKNNKAQKLALQHWLEAIDPRHRYGHNLHLYYDEWFISESKQPFFYWLDIGDGKEANLAKCPRNKLQHECVNYLGPKERQAYEVILESGKFVYKQSGTFVDTTEGSKWIFVLSTISTLYVGQKMKGSFHHSSFLAGGATIAAGRLIVKEGILKVVWPYSGHYLPTEENFKEFISFLQDNNVDLTDVQKCPAGDDDDYASQKMDRSNSMTDMEDKGAEVADESTSNEVENQSENEVEEGHLCSSIPEDSSVETTTGSVDHHHHQKWTTGAGPRIRCVRKYPMDLQFKALEQVNLSPSSTAPPPDEPIVSPRPNSDMRLSPTLAGISIPAPTITLTLPKHRRR